MNRAITPLLAATLVALLIACGGGGAGNAATPTLPASPVALPTADFSVDGIDPLAFCFDAGALPGDWTSDGQGVLDTTMSAAATSDPAKSEAELRAWGHVTGGYSLWKIVTHTPTPTKGQSQATEEQVAPELLEASYVSATCITSIFQASDGAQHGYEARIEYAKRTAAGQDQPKVTEIESPLAADASRLVDVQRPTYVITTLVFRIRNVVAEVNLMKPCGLGPAGPCDEAGEQLHPESIRLASLVRDELIR